MASSSALPKQLKEHLLEQQEPFRSHAYLLERGLTVKCLSSGVGNGCCSINLFKTPDRSPFSRELLLRSTRVLKLVLFKFVYANSGQDDEFQTAETKLEEESQTTRYQHRSSSKRNQPFFLGNMKQEHKCKLSNSKNSKIPKKTIQQKEWVKQKHLDLESRQNEASCIKELQVKSLNERYSNNGVTELNKATRTFCSNYQRTNGQFNLGQLIFDCIDESKGTQMEGKEKTRGNNIQKFMGFEGFGKHDSGKKNFKAITNAAELKNMIISSILAEWNNPEQLLRDVGIDIGDSIMDETIEETVQLLLHCNTNNSVI